MKKAVVFYLWGKRNAGDMAICLGTISLLEDLGYQITFVSRFADNQIDYKESKDYINHYHETVKVEPGLFSFDREESSQRKALSYINGVTKLFSPKDDQRLKELISATDVVFLNGGNLLRGNSLTDYARLSALFYPFRIAEKLKKPIICLPQSTAKSSRFGVKMLDKKLSSFHKVFIRESNSFTVLNEQLKGIPFVKSTDACFFIKDVPKASEKYNSKYSSIISNGNNIAIVLRSTTIGDLGEFQDNKKEMFTRYIKKFVKEFEQNYSIYFVVQTKKDKEFTQYVKDQIGNNTDIQILEEYDPYVIREIYRNMTFVLAMRLHAAILSMTAETPVIGYFEEEWGLKNPGIMSDVGMPWTNDGRQLIVNAKKITSTRNEYVEKIKQFRIGEKNKMVDAFEQDVLR